jgi:ParB-like chromosome segregation protein Spo0J
MSHDSVKAAFEKQVVLLPLDIIVPQKEVTQGHRSGEFYKQLTASLKHVGVIEPLVVYPRGPGDYLLLDGHVRLEILKSRTTATLTIYRPLRSISCYWRHLKTA